MFPVLHSCTVGPRRAARIGSVGLCSPFSCAITTPPLRIQPDVDAMTALWALRGLIHPNLRPLLALLPWHRQIQAAGFGVEK
jgi:hypothetical protein